MRVVLNTNLNFQRRLRTEEKADFSAVLKQGKEKVGNTGHSILIAPSLSFPGGANYGVGNLLSKEGKDFADFARQYWGINYIQLMPEGKYKLDARKCLPYSGSSLDLGAHLIDLELLTQKEYANILTKEDLGCLASPSKPALADEVVLYEKFIPQKSKTQQVLKKAYNELIKADTPEKVKILEQIKEFKQTNKDWLEPKAIFEALSAKYDSPHIENWNEVDRNLYNENVISIPKRKSIIDGIYKSEIGKEASFFEFKQFLAEDHLAKAKRMLNEKGIKLSGDVIVGFSPDEVWANPKAFVKDYSIGWSLPALDFNSSEGENLFRRKINLNAKRFDGVRIDASWSYSNQPFEKVKDQVLFRRDYKGKILDIIDEEFLKVKGASYNKDNIMHEFLAKLEDFDIYEGFNLKPFVEDRVKINSSNHMHENWGSVADFRARGWKDGTYILGTTNHDCLPMRKQFFEASAREEQARVLSEILKIPKNKLQTLNDFIKAKFAEPMRSKHNMMFFTEALNLEGQFKDNIGQPERDYRIKIPKNYQDKYFKSLEKGEGFNVMDALEKAFVAEGLDKKEPELYKKIVKYRKVLQEPEKGLNRRAKILFSTLALLGVVISAIILSKISANKKAE